ALRAHGRGGEVQQGRVARDEDQLVVVRRGGGADDGVAVLEGDDRPLVALGGGVGRRDALDDALRGAEGDGRGVGPEGGHGPDGLAALELDELADRDAAGQGGRAVRRGQGGQVEHGDAQHAARRGHEADVAARRRGGVATQRV